MISSKTKIGLLVAAHVVATPALAWLSVGSYHTTLSECAFDALEAAQITLLAIWLGLGTTKLRWRVLFAILGVCAESVIDFFWYWIGFGFEATGYAGVWFVGLCEDLLAASIILGCVRRRFQLRKVDPKPSQKPPIQFSLWHLMLLIFLVSVLLGLARVIRFRSNDSYTLDDLFTLDYLIASMQDAIAAVLTSSVIVWATMALGRPHLRVILAIVFAFWIGWWQSYGEEGVFWAAFHEPGKAVIAIASLLVFRSCGWRLVSRQRGFSGRRRTVKALAAAKPT